jgi:hypothetical protein
MPEEGFLGAQARPECTDCRLPNISGQLARISGPPRDANRVSVGKETGGFMSTHGAAPSDVNRRVVGSGRSTLLLFCIAAAWILLGTGADPAGAGGVTPAGALLASGLLDQAAMTAPIPTAQDYFGYSVALDGDTAVIGVPGSAALTGAAYVFVRVGGIWTVQQVLTASDGAPGDQFGCAVALDGDTALVGADHHDLSGGSFSGAAYVFTRTGSTWSQQAELAPSDHGLGNDRFGRAVALYADTAFVGAPMRDAPGCFNSGAAYAFRRSGTSWSQEAKIALPDPNTLTEDRFGCSLDVDGNSVVIGTDYRQIAGKGNTGAAYVYVRSGSSWTRQGTLLAPDAQNQALFGSAVALDGDRALVGAPRHDPISSQLMAGAAYTFRRLNGVWRSEGILHASDARSGDHFGSSVALSGSAALIGAPRHNPGGKSRAGATYAFWHTNRGWAECSELSSASFVAEEQSSRSVALSGTTALLGSPYHTTGEAIDAGAAYVYSLEAPPVTTAIVDPVLGPTGWTLQPTTVTLTATDAGSGVAKTEYRYIGSPDWSTYTVPFSVPGPGLWTYQYRSTDNLGFYEGVQSVSVGIGLADRPPVTSAAAAPAPDATGWNTSPVTVTLTPTYAFPATYPPDGIASTQYRVRGAANWLTYSSPFKVTVPGVTTYEYRSTDLAGVVEELQTLAVRLKIKPAITSLGPTRARRGATVTISGKSFGRARGTAYVTFGSRKCSSYAAWSDTRIKVKVPSKAAYGRVMVKVVTMSGGSNRKAFTVKR